MAKKPKRKYKAMDQGRIQQAMARVYNAFPIRPETVQEFQNAISVNVEVARGSFASHHTWRELVHPLVTLYELSEVHFAEETAAQLRDIVDKMMTIYKQNKLRLPIDRNWKIYPELLELIYAVRDIAPELLNKVSQKDLVAEMDKVTVWLTHYPALPEEE
jgi:hypothetical protein